MTVATLVCPRGSSDVPRGQQRRRGPLLSPQRSEKRVPGPAWPPVNTWGPRERPEAHGRGASHVFSMVSPSPRSRERCIHRCLSLWTMPFAERHRVMSGRTVARNSEVEAHGLQHLSTTKKKKKKKQSERKESTRGICHEYLCPRGVPCDSICA